MTWSLRLAFGWHLLGGVTTLAAFGLWLAGLPIAWAWGVTIVGAIALAWRWRGAPAEPSRPDGLGRAVLAVAVVAAVTTAATTLLPDWDGMAIWGVKAKLLAFGELDGAWLRAPLNLPAHPEYPLHVPLRGALVAQLVGWHDASLPLLLAFDAVAIGLLLLGTIEAGSRDRPTSWLLVGVLAVPALWDEVPRGYADPAVALAIAATLVALGRWLRYGDRGSLALAALSAGVGAWTKQEGLVLLLVAFGSAWLLAPCAERRRLPLVAAGALGVVWALPWQLFRRGLGIATEPFGWRGVEQLDRVPTILRQVVAEMATVGSWSLLWPTALVALAWLARRAWAHRSIDAERWLPTLAWLGGLGAWCAIYVATPHDVVWHLQTSLHRLLVQLAPAAMLAILAIGTERSAPLDQR